MSAILTIRVDPTFELGPFEIAWHGLMTASGIAFGALLVRVMRASAASPSTPSTRSPPWSSRAV